MRDDKRITMSKRILFMGTPDYATTIFDALIKSSYEIVGVFTQPDKPVGRKQVLTPPHIKQYCLDNGLNLPIYQPLKLRDNDEALAQIKALKPNFIIVAAYGQILPKSILDVAPCINLHASLLPKYRGASPIQEALLHDDAFTGVTSMLMEEGLDTGDILGWQYLKITPSMDVVEAFNALSKIAAQLTLDTLDKFDSIAPKKQDDTQSSLCKKIKKEYGCVDFTQAKKLVLKYKAYSFWPGVFLESGLKLKDVILVEEHSHNEEGLILDIEQDGIIIGCKKGSIKVKTLQAPSKKPLAATEYLKGARLSIKEFIK